MGSNPLVTSSGMSTPPHFIFDHVTLFGMAAVGLIVVCFTHEKYHRNYALIGGIGGLLAAAYAVMTPAWPMCIVGVLWFAAGLKRWKQNVPHLGPQQISTPTGQIRIRFGKQFDPESRLSRLFGRPLN
jgi:hypothetical protein